MKIRNFFLLFLLTIFSLQFAAIGVGVHLDRLSNQNALIKIIDADLEKSFEMYKGEIIGNLIVGNHELLKATLEKIAFNENLTYKLTYDGKFLTAPFVPCSSCRTKIFNLDYAEKSYGTITLAKAIPSESNRDIAFLFFAFVPLLLISILIVVFFHRWFEKSILLPLGIIEIGLKDRDTLSLQNQILELKSVPDEVKKSFESLIHIIEDSHQAKLLEEKNQIFKQVSHDIRSPLSALNMIVGTLTNVPEEKRILIRTSVNRITDIANQLLQKSKEEKLHSVSNLDVINFNINPVLSVELLPAMLELIISEKRVQFRENSAVLIESELDHGYGLFANVNSIEFKRVISNLINNAVEAMTHSNAKINVRICDDFGRVLIVVSDNGKGIPKHVLERLGREEVSYGKEGTESGSGIGVLHAKKTIESFGGTLEIKSQIGIGTEIIISLPSSEVPEWFVPSLNVNGLRYVIALDDDTSVLEVWRQRFRAYGIDSLLLTFTSAREFVDWIKNNSFDLVNTRFLMDFELIGQSYSGLDLIKNLSLGESAILVTSRYEERNIRTRCQQLGVKLIPKGMAPFIPIDLGPSRS